MKLLQFISVGAILAKLKEDGFFSISRPTFYRMERGGVFAGINYHRTSGNQRSFSKQGAIDILVTIWQDYRGKEEAEKYKKKLDQDLAEGKFFPHIKEY